MLEIKTLPKELKQTNEAWHLRGGNRFTSLRTNGTVICSGGVFINRYFFYHSPAFTSLPFLVHFAPSRVRRGCDDGGFDATLVRSPLNAEVTFLTPVGIPRVRHLPVLGARIHSPPNNTDGVTAHHGPTDVMVHSTNVIGKIGVHGKCSLDWSVLHDGLCNAVGSVVVVDFTL